MNDLAVRPRARVATGLFLVVVGVVGVSTYLAFAGSQQQRLATEIMVAGTCLLAGGMILRGVGLGHAWRGTVHLAYALFMVGLVNGVFLLTDVDAPGGYEPRAIDVAFAAFLVPIMLFARAEFRDHFDDRDSREIGTDVFLIVAAATAMMYMVVRPIDASPEASVTAAIFSVLTAAQVAAFGALLLWAPSRRHLVLFGTFVATAAATATFGWYWVRGSFDSTTAPIALPFLLAPLAFAAWALFDRDLERAGGSRVAPRRWARPILTSFAVLAACAALAVVAIVDDELGLGDPQSTAIILVLGLGIAARIESNQCASTTA